MEEVGEWVGADEGPEEGEHLVVVASVVVVVEVPLSGWIRLGLEWNKALVSPFTTKITENRNYHLGTYDQVGLRNRGGIDA